MRYATPWSFWVVFTVCMLVRSSIAQDTCYKDNLKWKGTIDWTVSGRKCQKWVNQFPHRHDYKDADILPELNASLAENYCRSAGGGGNSPWCFTLDPSVGWELCRVPKCPQDRTTIAAGTPTKLPLSSDCYRDSRVYSGQMSRTVSGRTCQKWIDQQPHEHNMTEASAFPDGSTVDAKNYCRDPSGKGFPWCYTTDPIVRMEVCPVPSCGSGDCFDDASQYLGPVAHTLGGEECMRWDRVRTIYADSNFPEGSRTAASNFCRDPDGAGAPWCFITASGRWKYCPVPRCHIQTCYHNSTQWMGKVSYTVSGLTCQRWDDYDPHSHTYTNANSFPDKSLMDAHNYCRDPDGYGKPWCFTTDPNVQWEECAVQPCGHDDCWRGKSTDYKGTIHHTLGGVRCQYWYSQFPHKHNIVDSPDESLAQAKNYCRDPDGKGAPWCYTVDKMLPWDYCPVPRCPSAKRVG